MSRQSSLAECKALKSFPSEPSLSFNTAQRTRSIPLASVVSKAAAFSASPGANIFETFALNRGESGACDALSDARINAAKATSNRSAK